MSKNHMWGEEMFVSTIHELQLWESTNAKRNFGRFFYFSLAPRELSNGFSNSSRRSCHRKMCVIKDTIWLHQLNSMLSRQQLLELLIGHVLRGTCHYFITPGNALVGFFPLLPGLIKLAKGTKAKLSTH